MGALLLYVEQMGFIPTSVEMVYNASRNNGDPSNGTRSNTGANDLSVLKNIYPNGLSRTSKNDIEKIPNWDDDKDTKNGMYHDHAISFYK